MSRGLAAALAIAIGSDPPWSVSVVVGFYTQLALSEGAREEDMQGDLVVEEESSSAPRPIDARCPPPRLSTNILKIWQNLAPFSPSI